MQLITPKGHPDKRLGLDLSRSRTLMGFHRIAQILGLEPPTATFDYSKGLQLDLGALWNDVLGDCAFAGMYHRMQVVAWRVLGLTISGAELRQLALEFYIECGGYDPSKTTPGGYNPTDLGGDMDSIARWLMTKGLATPWGTRQKFIAAFEIEPHDMNALAFCGQECLGLGLGIQITDQIMRPDGTVPKVWTPGGKQIGGHFIYAYARNAGGVWKFDSWGTEYALTEDFLRANLMQAVAYVNSDAFLHGKTVMGQDESTWLALMEEHAQGIH